MSLAAPHYRCLQHIFPDILAHVLAKRRFALADEHAADAEVAQQHGPAWPLRGTQSAVTQRA